MWESSFLPFDCVINYIQNEKNYVSLMKLTEEFKKYKQKAMNN